MKPSLVLLSLTLVAAGCKPKFDIETVTGKSGRDFDVASTEELPNYRGHCALKVTYLTEEREPVNLVKDAEELLEEYWGDKRATQCGLIMIQSDQVQERIGGLYYQTKEYRVLFDTDGAGHWRRAPQQ